MWAYGHVKTLSLILGGRVDILLPFPVSEQIFRRNLKVSLRIMYVLHLQNGSKQKLKISGVLHHQYK